MTFKTSKTIEDKTGKQRGLINSMLDRLTEMDDRHDDHEASTARMLKRCDALIFPFMELSNYFIPQPDVKTNPKVTYMLKLIDKLLD